MPCDPARARACFARGAELGDLASQVSLARCLAAGEGGARDIEEACRLYEEAAGRGSGDAASGLMELVIAQDRGASAEARALALLEKAVAGKPSPSALRTYARLLIEGRGVEADPLRAVELLDRATVLPAEDMEFAPSPRPFMQVADGAWHDLVYAMAHPASPKAARDRALALFRQGVQAGITPAQEALGTAHAYGLGVPRDYACARNLLEQAERCGSLIARYLLGALLFWGLAGEQDRLRGMAILEQAAGDGSRMACAYLARIYAKGDGGWPADGEKAAHFRREAENLGTGIDLDAVLAPPPFEDGDAWFRLWS